MRSTPGALPRVVGDRESWHRNVSARIETLTRSIHHGTPLASLDDILASAGVRPDERKSAQKLAQTDRRLAGFLDRIAWVNWREDDLRVAVRFALDHASLFRQLHALAGPTLEPRLPILLVDLAVADAGALARRLLETLTHPVALSHPLSAGEPREIERAEKRALEDRELAGEPPESCSRRPARRGRPAERLGPALLRSICRLS